MEQKTKIVAEEGKQELFITRTFDLPIEMLFRAYIDPAMVEQWMSTKVIKLEPQKQGAYTFKTSDKNGTTLLQSSGVIHDIVTNEKITRTFEMENTPYPVQLEYLEFEKIADKKSKLKMQVIYKSVAHRDAILKLPFAYGINMAHDKLQEIFNKLKY